MTHFGMEDVSTKQLIRATLRGAKAQHRIRDWYEDVDADTKRTTWRVVWPTVEGGPGNVDAMNGRDAKLLAEALRDYGVKPNFRGDP